MILLTVCGAAEMLSQWLSITTYASKRCVPRQGYPCGIGQPNGAFVYLGKAKAYVHAVCALLKWRYARYSGDAERGYLHVANQEENRQILSNLLRLLLTEGYNLYEKRYFIGNLIYLLRTLRSLQLQLFFQRFMYCFMILAGTCFHMITQY